MDFATTLLCVLTLLIYDQITFIVKEDLVYNAATDKIVGFTDLGPNRSTKEDLATHALQIYIRSITSRFSRPFAFFSTKNIKAHSLASIFWEVVYTLLTCGFDIVGLVADSASINRSLFHILNNDNKDNYKCVNIFKPDVPIFLIPDPPHLLKTICNSVRASKPNGTKLLRYGEHFILWEHFCRVPRLFNSEELRCCKLNDSHYSLTSFSKMRVNIAAQLLSGTVSKLMAARGGEEMKASSWLCALINKWWDLMNTRCCYGKNPDLQPYRDANDPRLVWLQDTFLGEINRWRDSIIGETRQEVSKQFLTRETYTGLLMATQGVVDLVKYILSHSPKEAYVVTKRINQDAVEAYFGHMRQIGRRCENPNINHYAQFENVIVAKKRIKSLKGSNVQNIVDWKCGATSENSIPKRKKK